MSGPTIRTFRLDTARSRVPKGVSRAAQQGGVQTRRSSTRPRRTCHGCCLGTKGQSRATGGCTGAGTVDGIDTRRGNSLRKDVLDGLGKRRDVLEEGDAFGGAWSWRKFVNVFVVAVDFDRVLVVAGYSRGGHG